LFEYGRDFPDFIAGYEYAQGVPWLADVARIERAWLDAYHAADADPITPRFLAAIPPDQLARVVFTPHPATRIVRSRFPAVSIFVANRNGDPTGPITATGPEDALITRPSLEVIVRRLPPGGATFLEGLLNRTPLGAAAAAAFADSGAFDLSVNIAGMIEAGAFVSVNQAEPSP
jgi:hypothetical protein